MRILIWSWVLGAVTCTVIVFLGLGVIFQFWQVPALFVFLPAGVVVLCWASAYLPFGIFAFEGGIQVGTGVFGAYWNNRNLEYVALEVNGEGDLILHAIGPRFARGRVDYKIGISPKVDIDRLRELIDGIAAEINQPSYASAN